MYCTRCGRQLKDDDVFCSGCGRSLRAAYEPVPPRRLMRLMYDKKIAGVCSGFARYFNVDVTVMRILWLVLALFTGLTLIAYPIAWICMPAVYTVQDLVAAETVPYHPTGVQPYV